MQNQSCFGGRLIVAPLVHLLLIPSTPMHLKLINNPLCYLTDHIIIREVQLKSCHTLIKKCSFNFFEQCTLYTYVIILSCLLTASSCFFFWTSSSSIRLTFAKSKFSWSGLNTSWKTCHLDPFWKTETLISNKLESKSRACEFGGFTEKETCMHCTYRMIQF